MPLNIGMITIDTTDARRLAEFWAAALETKVEQDYDGEYIVLAPSPEGSVRLALQRVPDPVQGKNRIHFDSHVEDRAAEVVRLVELGATEVAEHNMPGLSWTVLADPDGNQFCIAYWDRGTDKP